MYGAHASVCVFVYGVHSPLCLCVCSSIILCLIFRDRVSHWTWSSPLWLDTSPYPAHMLPGFCTDARGPNSGHHNLMARILPIQPSSQFNKLKSSGDKIRDKHNHEFIHKMCCHHSNHCYYRPGAESRNAHILARYDFTELQPQTILWSLGLRVLASQFLSNVAC